MTLALALTGFDISNPIPGIYPELRFAQGDTGGDLGPKNLLVLAPKTSAGAITVDTQVYGPINDEADAITQTGVGSIAHRMIKRILSIAKSANIYVLCPTTATGTAGIEIVTFVTNATGAGVVSIVIENTLIQASYANGDTVTTIAAAVSAAINVQVTLPVTATSAIGVVTFTAKTVGEESASLRIRGSITSGTGTTISPNTDIQFGSSGVGAAAVGTGTISYTAALATMLPRKFDYIVPASQVAAPLTALMTQVNTQAQPSTGFRQKVVAGGALTSSNSTTLASGAALNTPRARFVNQTQAPESHYMVGATCAAVYFANEVPDPSYNFDGYGSHAGDVMPIARPYNDAALYTTTQLKSMLNNGVTPIAATPTGQTYIVRSVTTYCLNGAAYDYRARDSCTVTNGDAFVNDMAAKLAAAPWTHVTSDPANISKQPLSKFATPARVKSVYEAMVTLYCRDLGRFDPGQEAAIIAAISVGQDPALPSRMNAMMPVYSAQWIHQHALLVKESSPAA